jgi:hypothetical protein
VIANTMIHYEDNRDAAEMQRVREAEVEALRRECRRLRQLLEIQESERTILVRQMANQADTAALPRPAQ